MFRNLSTVGLPLSGRPSELIELALSFGFDAMDIDILDFQQQADTFGVPHARRLMVSARLKAGVFHLPVELAADEAVFERDMKALPRFLELAEATEATRAVATIAPASDEHSFKDFFELHRTRLHTIGDLLAALRDLGVDARAESPGECPPVVIRSAGLRGGAATVAGGTSSQFASGLALAAPCMPLGMDLAFSGTLVSLPYLEMTRRVMAAFGGRCDVVDDRTWRIHPGGYAASDYEIEPDASAASYFFAAAAITGGRVQVDGLSRRSMQGDVAFCDALARMGCDVEWHEGDADGRGQSITVAGSHWPAAACA